MSTLGRPRLHIRLAESTNLVARALAQAGAPHGAIVTAGGQTAGRGRQGREWSSPPGTSLAASLVLRDAPDLLSLRAGEAVAEALQETLRRRSPGPGGEGEIQLKWPNDVLRSGRKVAGVLVEARPQAGWAVLGVGVNVAVARAALPPQLRAVAGTLGLDSDAVEPLLAELLRRLEKCLEAPTREVLDAVRARDALLGGQVSWAAGAGTGAGIDDAGRLLVDVPAAAAGQARRVSLEAGEVHLGSA